MNLGIQFQLGQHLTITPQLQQAIRLLQLSTIELQHEVQDLLESNIMLETEEEGQLRDAEQELVSDNLDNSIDNHIDAPTNLANQNQTDNNDPIYQEVAPEEQPLNLETTDITTENTNVPEEWQIANNDGIDTDWNDSHNDYSYDQYNLKNTGQQTEYDIIAQSSYMDTLRDYVTWQLNFITLSDQEQIIATAIIDSINDDGYLASPVEEILIGLQNSGNPKLSIAQMQSVLCRIQKFDPPGVAAQNLQECIYIQLNQLPKETPFRKQAIEICKSYFDLFALQPHTILKEEIGITDTELKEVMRLIRTLNPYPGTKFSKTLTQYIVPDIIVTKRHGVWHVELNDETIPRLRINPDYAKLVRRADRSNDNTCLKNHLQEARWLIKNLANRNETLLRVATKIVELQRNFFEYGLEAMRPMVLKDIADALSVHESTVSRVTNQKYLHSPRGTYELKFFFPSYVHTNSGGQCSATTIRALIKKLIAEEQPNSPLSDEMLSRNLMQQGIQVARRTIAKYRESMGIQASKARKRLL
ncbi:hypothetical protein TI05_09815 [Achromatium sp. WMS3]|nr:hypothetical protein TI05_09815 [Achromatium sp. WMS3]